MRTFHCLGFFRLQCAGLKTWENTVSSGETSLRRWPSLSPCRDANQWLFVYPLRTTTAQRQQSKSSQGQLGSRRRSRIESDIAEPVRLCFRSTYDHVSRHAYTYLDFPSTGISGSFQCNVERSYTRAHRLPDPNAGPSSDVLLHRQHRRTGGARLRAAGDQGLEFAHCSGGAFHFAYLDFSRMTLTPDCDTWAMQQR